MTITLKATKVAELEAAIASSTDATEKALLVKELGDVTNTPVTSDPEVEYRTPKATQRKGIVSNVKIRQATSKVDGHGYQQWVITLSDGSVFFFAYDPNVAIGDSVICFGVDTIANVTGYNSSNDKKGILNAMHTTTGFAIESIVVDVEANKLSASKATAAGKLEALREFAEKIGDNDKLIDTLSKLKGLI